MDNSSNDFNAESTEVNGGFNEVAKTVLDELSKSLAKETEDHSRTYNPEQEINEEDESKVEEESEEFLEDDLDLNTSNISEEPENLDDIDELVSANLEETHEDEHESEAVEQEKDKGKDTELGEDVSKEDLEQESSNIENKNDEIAQVDEEIQETPSKSEEKNEDTVIDDVEDSPATSSKSEDKNGETEIDEDSQEKTSKSEDGKNEVTEIDEDSQERTSKPEEVEDKVTDVDKGSQERTSKSEDTKNEVTEIDEDSQERTSKSEEDKVEDKITEVDEESQEKTSKSKEDKTEDKVTEIDEESQEKTAKSEDKNKDDAMEVVEAEKDQNEKSDKEDKNEKTDDSENKGDNAEDEFNGDMDMDEDFDPSLLCPEVSMDIEDGAVNTDYDTVPNDGSSSPSLYEPVFSTIVDEMTGAEITLNLTPAEESLRRSVYHPGNPVQRLKAHCSACNVHLGTSLSGQKNRFLHPLLKVLVCKTCYNFYTSGEFEKDEDGSELYCRWCGQGGQVFCCSSCEFVFCQKCIRNNFGRSKLAQVRDSEEWQCFRCDDTQLGALRAHASELFDYVRTEIGRAATLNDPDFLNIDHSMCCQKKTKAAKPDGEQPAKRRKRNSDTDQDYNPHLDNTDPLKIKPVKPVVKNNTVPQQLDAQGNIRPVILMPRSTVAQNAGQTYKIGNTTFRQCSPGMTQRGPSQGFIRIMPQIQNQQNRPRNRIVLSSPVGQPRPGQINQMPRLVRAPNQNNRMVRPVTPVRPGTPVRTYTPVRPQNRPAVTTVMKHEWFEKTVRSAARVNSNLSYTLTQLNRAQSQATTVEALAVVHNKLQEILSTSINSLIQIRKNLRSEFIAGIKTVKFPVKSMTPTKPAINIATTEPIMIPDDDVVIVSPPKSTPIPVTSLMAIPPLTAITLTKVSKTETITSSAIISTPSTSSSSAGGTGSSDKPKGYLKVKSFSDLLSVKADTITIDDDIAAKDEEDPLKLDDKAQESVILRDILHEKKDSDKTNIPTIEIVNVETVKSNISDIKDKEDPEKTTENENTPEKPKENGKSSKKNEISSKENDNSLKENELPKTMNLDDIDKSKPEIDRLLNCKVVVKDQNDFDMPKTIKIDEIDKSQPEIERMMNCKVLVKKDDSVEERLKKSTICNGKKNDSAEVEEME